MKRRLLIPIVFAGTALSAGAASASTDSHTLKYFRDYGLLLEVSADPRDGTDFVQTNPTHATRLELVALKAPVRLRGITLRFADGRTYSQPMSTIRPGERVMLDLPRRAGIIQSVELDYGPRVVDRTPARLQIVPHDDRSLHARPLRRDHREYDRGRYPGGYDQKSRYEYQPRQPYDRTEPSYTVRPRSTWSGSIQGTFRF